MSNGARHALGVIAGLIMAPLLLVGLSYGMGQVTMTMQRTIAPSWLGLGVLAACGVLLGLLAGSRLSPLASLIAGLGYTLLGVAQPLAQLLRLDVDLAPTSLPRWLGAGYSTLLFTGLLLFLGLTLLTVSVLPSRWRSARRLAAQAQPYYPQAEQHRPQPEQQFQQPPPEQYRPEPYQGYQHEPYQQPEPYRQQPDPFSPPPSRPAPTQHLPTFPEQPPPDPEDSTRPMNRD